MALDVHIRAHLLLNFILFVKFFEEYLRCSAIYSVDPLSILLLPFQRLLSHFLGVRTNRSTLLAISAARRVSSMSRQLRLSIFFFLDLFEILDDLGSHFCLLIAIVARRTNRILPVSLEVRRFVAAGCLLRVELLDDRLELFLGVADLRARPVARSSAAVLASGVLYGAGLVEGLQVVVAAGHVEIFKVAVRSVIELVTVIVALVHHSAVLLGCDILLFRRLALLVER